MRIIIAHNAYRVFGGEDSVVADEIELLRAHGHEVIEYRKSNDDIGSVLTPLRAARENIWSTATYNEVEKLCLDAAPDVVHVHNTTPLISASIFWAAARTGVPTVHTLHNVRSMCLNGLFLRESRTCEDCKGNWPWRGVARGCYRGSRAGSAALAASIVVHRSIGTYSARVHRYIALSESSRRRFIEGGFPENRIVVKPNFSKPQEYTEINQRHGYLYVGRLSSEKGADVLIDALSQNEELAGETTIVGGGPDEAALRSKLPHGKFVGARSRGEVLALMAKARAVIVPSICFENFPKVIVEAFSFGTPVIASRIGALAEVVRHGDNGLLFTPGSAQDLLSVISEIEGDQHDLRRLSAQAYSDYFNYYTPTKNYNQLIEIYREAIEEAHAI